MCRSIKTLRQPEGLAADHEIQEAALQFVRKISGYRKPSQANQEVLNAAVLEVSDVCRRLLGSLTVRT